MFDEDPSILDTQTVACHISGWQKELDGSLGFNGGGEKVMKLLGKTALVTGAARASAGAVQWNWLGVGHGSS